MRAPYIALTLTTAVILIAIFVWGSGYIQTVWTADSAPQRWYTPAQVSTGEGIFIQNCLSCHGERGRGTANWRQRQQDGLFPPPPLNGSAHTWHHPLLALKRTIKNGGIPLGGKMPAFGDVLNGQEIESVIAYLQSQWPEEIYKTWEQRVNKKQ